MELSSNYQVSANALYAKGLGAARVRDLFKEEKSGIAL